MTKGNPRLHAERGNRTVGCFLAAGLILATCSAQLRAAESPSSSGPAAMVDTPILRIPPADDPPTIDGKFEEGEWEDASALSGFWYDFSQADFRFMAPIQTQLQLYAAYDKENLYFAYVSPVYPKGSWLRARARFPDVISHPLYGLQWDDHIELELRPYHDNIQGFRLGLFKWFANPIGTSSDQYWSQQSGEGKRWTSKSVVRSQSTPERWVIEMAVPLESMKHGLYAGNDERGQPLVTLPPPDGTAYRCWFTRGIGGNMKFFNCFDAHIFNVTKTKLIFDSQAPSFQINELGPIMDDVVDVRMTVKNHAERSQTVRLGFFIESAEGLIYSSYDEDEELNEGLLELRPGEVRNVRLRQPFPGISRDGNVLWFDVRAAGQPAKTLFLTRLIRFHSMDGGQVGDQTFRRRRLDVIAELRPPRQDFDLRVNFSPYTRRLAAVVDTGIHGASREAQSATEARVLVLTADLNERIVAEGRAEFGGDFAIVQLDLAEKIARGETYKVSCLLFDENKRIVGEMEDDPFRFDVEPWMGNKLGLEDRVWEPFVPIEQRPEGFDTLKHRFTLDATGLPAQIYIKPDVRDLPLEHRRTEWYSVEEKSLSVPPISPGDVPLSDEQLTAIGRGPQLRRPLRLEAVVGGKRIEARITSPAKLQRRGKSEFDYASRVKIGPIEADLRTRYDCDGSMHVEMDYGAKQSAEVDAFEMVMEPAGPVDVAFCQKKGSMAGADRWEITLPEGQGVIWKDNDLDPVELFYTQFTPWFRFGSGDRSFSYYSDSDEGWLLDRDGETITLERDRQGQITWRVKFVNHRADVEGRRRITFSILTHPAKSKPAGARRIAWFYRGDQWAALYPGEPLEPPPHYFPETWRFAAGAPKDLPESQRTKFRRTEPPWTRYGRWRNIGITAELDRQWQDKIVHYFEKHVREGRRTGWWWDEYWPPYRSEDLADGDAYLRDPEAVREDELPWKSKFLTTYMRDTFKRLSRIQAANNVPQRNYLWANNSATMLEAFAWDTQLVEEAGAGHRSYDIDNVVAYPTSLWRALCHTDTGLIARIVADHGAVPPGDDPRLDRQFFGRALLNDIGVCFDGPHGRIQQLEEALPLLAALDEFGLFDELHTEVLPYWRNADAVEVRGRGQEKINATVYRRPIDPENPDAGYKALFVLMNENDEPVEPSLVIADPERIFGGPNNLSRGEIRSLVDVPDVMRDLWPTLAEREAGAPALRDVETGEVVARAGGSGETYGPVFVGRHDYRVLYGHQRR